MPTSRLITRSVPPRLQWQLEQQGLPPLLARLYAARGIQSADELNDEFKALIPPSHLGRATEAAALLADAIEADARLLIVADYDCDGATACAVGVRALRRLMAGSEGTVDYLVPNRFSLGYGLSPEIVDLAAERSPDLLITVDSGIADIAGVDRARQLGMAVLITDHHLPGATLPDADCIVNPNQPGCTFPSKSMAGVGVMFYVMLALRAELRQRGWFNEHPEPNLAELLDLVALGTVADVVKLDRNNRILVSQGLKRMREGKMQPGIRALLTAAGRQPQQLSAQDLGFLLGPRLNAAGRISDMALGIECLITDDESRALSIGQELDRLNRERRDIESDMQEQAALLLDSMADTVADSPALALFDPGWHQGVIGILAARLKDRLHRPIFAFARGDNGEIKGSGRSIPGLHLRDVLDLINKRAPGLLQRFGGHAAAAGATLPEARFAEFRDLFAEIAREQLSPADLTRTLETDGRLEEGYYSLETARLLDQQVWGQGFPAPCFADTFTVEQQRLLKDKHLKLRLKKGNTRIDAIAFNCTEVPPGPEIAVAFRLGINEFRGVENLQLMVETLQGVGQQ